MVSEHGMTDYSCSLGGRKPIKPYQKKKKAAGGRVPLPFPCLLDVNCHECSSSSLGSCSGNSSSHGKLPSSRRPIEAGSGIFSQGGWAGSGSVGVVGLELGGGRQWLLFTMYRDPIPLSRIVLFSRVCGSFDRANPRVTS
jgi:hypothetical protein